MTRLYNQFIYYKVVYNHQNNILFIKFKKPIKFLKIIFMSFVPRFVGGAYASKKIALQWLAIIQPVHTEKLRILRVKRDDCYLYYVVYYPLNFLYHGV